VRQPRPDRDPEEGQAAPQGRAVRGVEESRSGAGGV